MATFTERHEHKVEVIPPFSILQCRRSDIIEKDGVEVAKTYHRHSVAPGADVSNECDEIKAIAGVLWTPEVIAAYQEHLKNQEQRGPGASSMATVVEEPPAVNAFGEQIPGAV